MRTKVFVLAIILAAAGRAGAQGPPSPQPAGQTPPAVQPPRTPDFVVPRPQGAPPEQTPPAESYVIGPQDNLSIIVTDENDLTGKYRVDTDGTISMPYLQRVQVAGLTLAEAQSKITTLLKAGYFRNPQVRVEVDQFKARSVIVNGEVRTPGKVTLPGSTISLLEALILAGSPTTNAANEVIVIHPPKPGEPPSEPITVNRKELELGRAGRDVVLQDGDIVNVPQAKRFYISGFVKNPGYYVLDIGTTVSQAIVLAGGLSDRGSDRRVRVQRTVNGKSVELPIELEDKVQPNDEIKIRARIF
ncbi:MAG TPA: polysaccharide biosynthesis/export family protein [Vicinamibacterales bacterium]|nr:polysaccharide biosynthesis/export family protein [Vicinamibacterales bacterium]